MSSKSSAHGHVHSLLALLMHKKIGDRFLVSGFIILCNKLSALHSSGNHTLDDLLTEYKIENYDGRHGH